MGYNMITTKNKYKNRSDAVPFLSDNPVLARLFNHDETKQITPIYKDNNCEAYEVWNAKHTVSRVTIVMKNTKSDANITISKQFGNVDIILLADDNESSPVESTDIENDLTALILGYTSKFLSNGQLLNLSSVGHYFQDADLSLLPTNERIYFENYKDHKQKIENKRLIDLPVDFKKPVLHFTDFKEPILQSGEVRVSRSGCLGSAVYCTSLVGENEDALSGFAWGLNNRKVIPAAGEVPDYTPSSKKFLGVSLKNGGNETTNWFNRFGYGSLYLEASIRHKNEITRENNEKSAQCYNKIASNCVNAYASLYEFVQPIMVLLNSNQDNLDFSSELEKIYSRFESAQDGYSKIFLNNLIFDIIKDYILILDNKENPSDYINHDDSFDMHKQYEIVFSLAPSMKKNWNTVDFCPSLTGLRETLIQYGYPLSENEGYQAFAKFLVQNLYFYLGKVVLNNNLDLPEPSSINSFDDIAKNMPGLAGVMWHFYGAGESRGQSFFDEYLSKLRECEFESNTENGIVYSVKCGMYRTEEVGIYKNAEVSFFEPNFVKNEASGQYLISQDALHSSLEISACPSDTNGMTVRAKIESVSRNKLASPKPIRYQFFAEAQNSLLLEQAMSQKAQQNIQREDKKESVSELIY
ncbi:MAG: hypothetical protein HKM04_03940 [Legionellales bacterium]|nr:hypothetical protein [Legionellales bacterium]